MSRLQSVRIWTLLALVFGVLPLWLSSLEMWDGVVGMYALDTHNWETLKDWLLDSNWYLTYGMFLLADAVHQFAGLPYWVFFKLWITAMVLGIAWESYRLAIDVFEIPATVARWLPAMVFSFPIWYVFFSYTSMLGHLTCAWLGLLGYRLVHGRKAASVAAGAVLVAISFQLASNCAFLLALEAGRWLLFRKRSAWSYARSVTLLTLAVAVFAATRVIWPPVGTYVGYNRLLSPLSAASWLSYAKYTFMFGTWLVLLVPGVAWLCWTAHRLGTTGRWWARLKQGRNVALALAAAAGAACFAYIAVGVGSPLFVAHFSNSSSVSAVLAANSAGGPISVWYGGWGARHLLLMMIPMLLLAAWLTATAEEDAAPATAARPSPPPFHLALALTVTAGLAAGIPGHWGKLKRIAHQHTVVQAMAALPQIPGGRVDLLLNSRVDYLDYIYEANYLLSRAWGGTKWAALMLPDQPAVQAWGDIHRKLTLAQPPKEQVLTGRLNLMNDYNWAADCKTVARVELPRLGLGDVLWRAEQAPASLPRAQVTPVSSTCQGADPFWRGASGNPPG